MNVGGIQERVQPGFRLERQKGHVGAAGEPPLEPWPGGTRTAQDQMNVRMRPQPLSHLGQDPQTLLLAHAAGIQRDHLMFGDAQLATQHARRGKRPDRVGVDPIREQAQAALGDAEAPQPSVHAHADGRDQVEATHQPAICAAQQAPQPRRSYHAEAARRLHFQVLHVQAGPCAAQPGGDQCGGSGERGRLDRPDQIGAEAHRLPKGGQEAAQRERCEMRDAPRERHRARQPDGTAQH